MEKGNIRLYNTPDRKKVEFVPIEEGKVKMYSCGPTVYDYAHLGHFRAYVFVDVLKRVLKFNGFDLKTVMNITDVGHLTSDADTGEDKIEKAAREEEKDAWEISEYYTKDFFESMGKLNVEKADIICKATEHIEQMIELIKKLEENGYTYRTSDGIYYDTSKFEKYADFANLNLDELKEGVRIDANPEKRNPSDFALWKFSPDDKERQMEWDSPWGKGFPGWHIECSAMSMHYLGNTFDIHTGGVEHIPIHHTNEIAQAEGATGEKFVNYWLHNEHLLIDGKKMSKSKKNFYNMEDIEAKGFDPMAIRYLFLTAHYRSRVNFSWDSLETAEKTLNKLRDHVLEWKNEVDSESDDELLERYEQEFIDAINDDLNTTIALSTVWKLTRDEDVSEKDKLELILKFDQVLGLGLKEFEPGEMKKLSDEVKELIEKRDEFRERGKYYEADEIRKMLDRKFGVIIEDTENGTKWKRK